MGLLSRLFSHDKEPQKPAKKPGVRVVSHTVAGTSYRQKEIQAMGKINPDYALDKRGLLKRWPQGVTVYEYTFSPKKAELVPEPENPHDPKAIKVLVDGAHVGYIKAGSCSHIHKLLRENRIQSIKPSIIGGKYKELFSFDQNARRSEDFELEKGSSPFGVRLEIAEIPPVSR
jgi:hypothetical protein